MIRVIDCSFGLVSLPIRVRVFPSMSVELSKAEAWIRLRWGPPVVVMMPFPFSAAVNLRLSMMSYVVMVES